MAKEDIEKALTELDSSNDGHWTDDGLPRIDVIQSILKDHTITRKDVSAAAPGFARATSTENTEPEDIHPDDPEESITAAPVADNADLQHEDGLNLDPADPLSDITQINRDQLKITMEARISTAEARLEEARQATRDAVEYERKCTAWADKAKLDFNRQFPPLHPSDAIKAHIASQLEQRYLAAGLVPPGKDAGPASPIDALMGVRKKQGRVYQAPAAPAAR